MKELSTTHDGETWDETQWTFDPATGLVTNKVYADDSAVAYSYADDGQPERTTWARGDWKENVYTPIGLLAGTTYSDSTPSTAFTITLSNGNVFTQALQRERSRPEIVSRVVNAFNDVPIGQSVYTHDEISRRIQRLDSSGATTITNTFGYNARSEVTPASILSNAYAYAYDHQSRRVTKWTPSYTTTFIYDGWKLVQELTHTQTHTLTNFYVWGKDLSGNSPFSKARKDSFQVEGGTARTSSTAWAMPRPAAR